MVVHVSAARRNSVHPSMIPTCNAMATIITDAEKEYSTKRSHRAEEPRDAAAGRHWRRSVRRSSYYRRGGEGWPPSPAPRSYALAVARSSPMIVRLRRRRLTTTTASTTEAAVWKRNDSAKKLQTSQCRERVRPLSRHAGSTSIAPTSAPRGARHAGYGLKRPTPGRAKNSGRASSRSLRTPPVHAGDGQRGGIGPRPERRVRVVHRVRDVALRAVGALVQRPEAREHHHPRRVHRRRARVERPEPPEAAGGGGGRGVRGKGTRAPQSSSAGDARAGPEKTFGCHRDEEGTRRGRARGGGRSAGRSGARRDARGRRDVAPDHDAHDARRVLEIRRLMTSLEKLNSSFPFIGRADPFPIHRSSYAPLGHPSTRRSGARTASRSPPTYICLGLEILAGFSPPSPPTARTTRCSSRPRTRR